MIQINKIEYNKAEHFDPDGNSLGFLNDLENLDLRAQLIEQNLEGYYLIWEGKRIDISKDGNLSSFPRNMWDLHQQAMARIFRAQQAQRKINQ